MAKKTSSKAKTAKYVSYKSNNTWLKNKKKKIEKHIKNNPNDSKAIEALDQGFIYNKHKPKAHKWSSSKIKLACLFKEFSGKFSEKIFDADPSKKKEGFLEMKKHKIIGKNIPIDFSIKNRTEWKHT